MVQYMLIQLQKSNGSSFKYCLQILFFSDLLFRAKSIILYQCYIIGKIDISAFFCFL